MDLAHELERTLRESADRLGVSLNENTDEVRNYTSERMLHLSGIIDEPGYSQALVAEGINVALKAVEGSVETADEVDKELLGMVIGALSIGARAVAV